MNLSHSEHLYGKATAIIPGAAQTISKRPGSFLPEGWPKYFDRASGTRIWDVDGNQFTDFVMALGPIILGYADDRIDEAVKRQVSQGVLSSLQSPLEISVSEQLIECVPSAEMVRFFKTGAEATSCAVRLARAVTGRETVLSSGYAGWHDWWVAKLDDPIQSRGVPKFLREKTIDVAFDDIENLRQLAAQHADDLACIIVEPRAIDHGGRFLAVAREIADTHGAILVFDEIVTGFRLGLGGAQARFGVTPDLTTLGKALANGYSLAACVGRRDIMREAATLWITSTFAGDALALAAAKATIDCLIETDAIERINSAGTRLLNGWREICTDEPNLNLSGLPAMPNLRFMSETGVVNEAMDEAFVRMLLESGVLWRRDHPTFICASHSDAQIDRVLEVTEAFLSIWNAGHIGDTDGRIAAV